MKPPLFTKLLVANRGEIACRVMRTAKKLGIRTVAVFSEPDARAPHVALADESVCVGPAASSASYLNVGAIMQAIRDTGAAAVHPGYGFLSENAAFAEAVEAEGVAFVGPGPFAIQAMGDKIESKKLASEAGVSTIPGFQGVLQDEDEAAKVAAEVGFPVMIKASAGGGGKGMRIAWNEAEARSGFAVSSREAASSFGDDRIFIERYVQAPRHIEIQLIADSHGNCIYLPERDCSIQRRNQKVVEEAPAVGLSAETFRRMGEEAVALAKAVGYRSAGTVEFLVDASQQHYFLEMNTRLQVEHPVTEMVAGLDLVEQMIRVAAGEKLSLRQEDVSPKGWAIECRVYAEDPLRGFLPSIGTLSRYSPPTPAAVLAATPPTSSDGEGVDSLECVRVDDGCIEGGEISMYYDPMIAKLITHGKDREEARERMIAALDRYTIRGLRHNTNFLRSLMAHPRFISGQYTTGFIGEEFPDGYAGHQLAAAERLDLLACVAALQQAHQVQSRSAAPAESRSACASLLRLRIEADGEEEHDVEVAAAAGHVSVARGGEEGWHRSLRLLHSGLGAEGLLEAEVSGGEALASRLLAVQVHAQRPLGWEVTAFGTAFNVLVRSQRVAELSTYMKPPVASANSNSLVSPMPGVLVSVKVAAGDAVFLGQELCVVEAMKMQNVLLAERDGVVSEVLEQPGAVLSTDQPIVAFADKAAQKAA